MLFKQAEAELVRRGFVYSHNIGNREYWKRTDGKLDVPGERNAVVAKEGAASK